ncbi:hypothetical protein [Streptomyces sedi]|uniref:Uncharacterized protein n=1 Tax=Streptomyces sedi TaxID=555059 RepID=A0A5C4VF12_9ACTN|nr:hypothetical protein [Streptomyces sedi]TNM34362.1 hypothetical protein FH715_01385 [Streptomyces sedi]
MPDDVGGPPFPDGEGPDSQEAGAADEALAAVVFDEEFVTAARVHEPSAEERSRAAAAGRADPEGPGFYRDPDLDPGGGRSFGRFEGTEAWERAEGRTDAEEPAVRDGRDDPDGSDGLDELDALAELDDPDSPENEGRFDRSDYTRYLPDPADSDDPHERAEPGSALPARRAPAPAGRARRPMRWQRPVACVLAMVMSLSVIALTLIAIQRASSGREQRPAPPPTVRPGQSAPQATGTPAGETFAGGAELVEGGP